MYPALNLKPNIKLIRLSSCLHYTTCIAQKWRLHNYLERVLTVELVNACTLRGRVLEGRTLSRMVPIVVLRSSH